MNQKELNIFLIDDNDIDIVVNTKLLKLANLTSRIRSFSNGTDALNYISSNVEELNQYQNVILLDIQMPVYNGFEIFDKFMELSVEIRQQCKVFMLSSSIDRNDIKKAEENEEIIKVLEKPLDVYLLKRLVSV